MPGDQILLDHGFTAGRFGLCRAYLFFNTGLHQRTILIFSQGHLTVKGELECQVIRLKNRFSILNGILPLQPIKPRKMESATLTRLSAVNRCTYEESTDGKQTGGKTLG